MEEREKRSRGTDWEFRDDGETKPCVHPCSPPTSPPHPSFSSCIYAAAWRLRAEGGGARDMEDD